MMKINLCKQNKYNDKPASIAFDDRGAVALVLVVWVVVVLMAIVGEFAYSMRTEINIVRNFKEEEEAYHNICFAYKDSFSSSFCSTLIGILIKKGSKFEISIFTAPGRFSE